MAHVSRTGYRARLRVGHDGWRFRKGDWQEAQLVLEELYSSGERDTETVGILARTWMDRYRVTGDQSFLRRSRDLYAEAFAAAPDDSYVGINAASKSVLLGHPD